MTFGSIPASAGEPNRHLFGGGQERVYPRECGGTGCNILGVSKGQGLSPRVRGNRAKNAVFIPCPGSIPASAGEPIPALSTTQPLKVYPRECGGTFNY